MQKISVLFLVIVILLSMSGCNKKEKEIINDVNETTNHIVRDNEVVNKKEVAMVEEIKTVDEVADTYDMPIDDEMTEKETVSYFQTIETKINEYVNKENFEKVKDKVTDLFILSVDFIFYGTEINGVTFNELTEETKTQILRIVDRIDNAIEKKQPDYKIIIKEKTTKIYDNVSERTRKLINKTDNYLNEKVGEEKYQNFKKSVNEFGNDSKEIIVSGYEGAKKIAKSGFSKAKSWYENMRDN
ncbi:MAG: hypothetical protein PHD10_02010 [Bacilli bacterium]|nr:hypothetical protein [Bacilli bacterium]MDD4607898.1 hypothetical protein [Bacilli bacterium]